MKELLPCPDCEEHEVCSEHKREKEISELKAENDRLKDMESFYKAELENEREKVFELKAENDRLKAELFTAIRFRTEDATHHLEDLNYKQKEVDKLKAALHSAEERVIKLNDERLAYDHRHESDTERIAELGLYQIANEELEIRLSLAKDALEKIASGRIVAGTSGSGPKSHEFVMAILSLTEIAREALEKLKK